MIIGQRGQESLISSCNRPRSWRSIVKLRRSITHAASARAHEVCCRLRTAGARGCLGPIASQASHPQACEEIRPPRRDIRRFPQTPPPLSLSWSPSVPPATGKPSARFTSKCRKMSQNVALFHTPTRRMTHFTSKKPHVFGQNPAILPHSRSFPRPRVVWAASPGMESGHGFGRRLHHCFENPLPRPRGRVREGVAPPVPRERPLPP